MSRPTLGELDALLSARRKMFAGLVIAYQSTDDPDEHLVLYNHSRTVQNQISAAEVFIKAGRLSTAYEYLSGEQPEDKGRENA